MYYFLTMSFQFLDVNDIYHISLMSDVAFEWQWMAWNTPKYINYNYIVSWNSVDGKMVSDFG